MTLEISDFDLQSVVSDTINILSYSARKKGLKLTLAIDTEVPSVFKGDACRLRQIVTNLVGNAVKFAAEGEVTLHIQKDSEDEQTATLRFTVCDSGIGIAAEKHTVMRQAR